MTRTEEGGAWILGAESGDDPEAILAAVREAREQAEVIVLDLREASGLGLQLTPGPLLPEAVYEEVMDQFGVDPEDAPIDRTLRLVLDAAGLETAGHMGYADYWRLAESVEEALL